MSRRSDMLNLAERAEKCTAHSRPARRMTSRPRGRRAMQSGRDLRSPAAHCSRHRHTPSGRCTPAAAQALPQLWSAQRRCRHWRRLCNAQCTTCQPVLPRHRAWYPAASSVPSARMYFVLMCMSTVLSGGRSSVHDPVTAWPMECHTCGTAGATATARACGPGRCSVGGAVQDVIRADAEVLAGGCGIAQSGGCQEAGAGGHAGAVA